MTFMIMHFKKYKAIIKDFYIVLKVTKIVKLLPLAPNRTKKDPSFFKYNNCVSNAGTWNSQMKKIIAVDGKP
jgi:hypothetical protein